MQKAKINGLYYLENIMYSYRIQHLLLQNPIRLINFIYVAIKCMQKSQKGEIGITLVTHWFVPKTPTLAALKASNRAIDFYLGW